MSLQPHQNFILARLKSEKRFTFWALPKLEIAFYFLVQTKKEKATWFYLRSSAKIRV